MKLIFCIFCTLCILIGRIAGYPAGYPDIRPAGYPAIAIRYLAGGRIADIRPDNPAGWIIRLAG